MTTIFVVFGETGQYEDEVHYPVCAYTSKDLADQHVVAANRAARKIWKQMHGPRAPEELDGYDLMRLLMGRNVYDPGGLIDDMTGTEYYYTEIKVREELPS